MGRCLFPTSQGNESGACQIRFFWLVTTVICVCIYGYMLVSKHLVDDVYIYYIDIQGSAFAGSRILC